MKRALVVGGGIAGPVAAMALQRAGIDVRVFEAHLYRPDVEVGSWLTIAVNALDALDAIGARHTVTDNGFPTPFNQLISGAGTPLRTFHIGRALADGTLSHTVKRCRFSRALNAEAASRGIDIAYDKRIVSAASLPSGEVVARFADGSDAVGDLLVGCDGLRSIVRSTIDPDAPPPRFVDMVNFGGYTQPADAPESTKSAVGTWHMRYGRHAFFGHLTDPIGGVVWFGNIPGEEVSADVCATKTDQAWREYLIELFRGDTGPAAELVAVSELEVVGDNVFDHPSTPRWHTDNMVVIGDAAHAPSSISGQGAGMAIEDAVVLAQCVRDAADLNDALVAYDDIRRARVERMVNQVARGISNRLPGRLAYGTFPHLSFRRHPRDGTTPDSPIQKSVRDVLLRLAYRFLITDTTVRWSYEHHIDWSASVLPTNPN